VLQCCGAAVLRCCSAGCSRARLQPRRLLVRGP